MGRWGRIHKQRVVDHKETRGYWRLKEKTIDCVVWGTRFGQGCGLIIRQTTE
jgi:hypothetical protein